MVVIGNYLFYFSLKSDKVEEAFYLLPFNYD